MRHSLALAALLTFSLLAAAGQAQPAGDFAAHAWLSSEYLPKSSKWFTDPPPASAVRYRLARQADLPITRPGPEKAGAVAITVDPAKAYQTVTGIGASFDESSCYAIQKNHDDAQIKAILRELIDPNKGMGLTLFRVCFGTSDFSDARGVSDHPKGWYSYQPEQDGPFSIENDRKLGILRVIKLAQDVAKESGTTLQFFGSAWSPPGWMKDSGKMVGGRLKPGMEGAYAAYLRKAVQAYRAEGVPMLAVTTNNEHYFTSDAYPGCYFDAKQEAALVRALGKEFAANGVKAEIWLLDHNFDIWPEAAKTLESLKDSGDLGLAGAVAFHHYGGKPADVAKLHERFPTVPLQFTEGSVWGTEGIAEIARIFRNGSRSYVYWVPMVTRETREHIQGPYNAPGILSPTLLVAREGGAWHAAPEVNLIGQVSRFVRPGAVRVDSGEVEPLTNVAFKNPDGTLAVVVVNQNAWAVRFTLRCERNQIAAAVPAGSVATYTFQAGLGKSTLAPAAAPAVDGPQAPPTGDGKVVKEWWTGMKGGLKGLANDPRFPNQPTGTATLNALITSDRDSGFKADAVTRIRGRLAPNVSGAYDFSIAADGYGELWLSPDADPAHKRLVAKSPGWAMVKEFGKYPEQSSDPIPLEAGKTYYVEVLQQGGGGNGNVAVAWSLPGLGNQQVIAGGFLNSP